LHVTVFLDVDDMTPSPPAGERGKVRSCEIAGAASVLSAVDNLADDFLVMS